MELQRAKTAVLEATKKLVASHLVARTWGNISCRVGEGQFLITPSGKAYEGMTEEQLVLVSLQDLSYEGEVKPSSEKGIHALVYRLHPEARFVIHTHQEMASLASLLAQDIQVCDEWKELLGETIPTAHYGLPGTKGLQNHIHRVLKENSCSSILMASHGVLCFGTCAQEAFSIAEALEIVCDSYIKKRSPVLGSIQTKPELSVIAQRNDGKIIFSGRSDSLLQDCSRLLLEQRAKDGFIFFLESEEVLKVASTDKKLGAYLDDFAQIAGPSIVVVKQKDSASLSLKNRDALLLEGVGAFCYGKTEKYAEAVGMLVQKNCKAALLSKTELHVHPLPLLDRYLMRAVYTHTYATLQTE